MNHDADVARMEICAGAVGGGGADDEEQLRAALTATGQLAERIDQASAKVDELRSMIDLLVERKRQGMRGTSLSNSGG